MQTPYTQKTTLPAQTLFLHLFLFFITNLPFQEHEKKNINQRERVFLLLFLGWRYSLFYGQYSLYFMGHF